MARYSLMAENRKTGEKQLIKVKELNNNGEVVFKEKVNLSTIDKYTLRYADETSLSEDLHHFGIIPFDDAKLYIEYTSKGVKTQLPIAYSDLVALNYFATNAPVKVSLIDPKYIETINNFLKRCKDIDFLEFQIREGYLHEYNEEYVKTYVRLSKEQEDPRAMDSVRSLIYTLLNRYKRIRGIIVGEAAYSKHLASDTYNVEIIDNFDEEPDKDIFGTGYIGDRQTNQKVIEHKFINTQRVSTNS